MILAPHGHLSHLAGRGLANRRWPRWARRASHDAWNLCTLSARPRSRRCRPARHSVRWPAVSSLSGRVVASFPRRSSASLGLDSVLTRKYRIGRTSRRRAGAGDARRRGERHRRRHLLGPADPGRGSAGLDGQGAPGVRAGGHLPSLGNVLRAPKGPGLFLILPFGIDRIRKVNLQTVAMNVPPQDVITRDNMMVRVDAVVYLRVVDPVKAVVEINNVDLPEELLQDLYLATRSQRSGEADARLNESMGGITAGPDSLAAVATRDVEPKAKQEVHEQARQVAHPKIFLCYRREDTQWVARSIYENLSAKYGPKQVFRDIDSTPAGIRFSTWLEARIGQCDLMIVLIGDAWSSAKDQAGRQRLELPND